MSKRIFSIIFLLFAIGVSCSQISASQRNARTNPKNNIVYPQTMAKNAKSALDKAVKAHNAPAAIAAIQDFASARIAIADSNIADVISAIDKTTDEFADNPAAESLLTLFKAKIYGYAYNLNSWNYDRRQLPAEPLPDDYTEWSGNQFRSVICSLVSKAVSGPATLAATPLTVYKQAVKIDEDALIYYPTLLDFICTNGTALLEECSTESINLLNDNRFAEPDLDELINSNLLSEVDRMMLKLIATQLQYASPDSASEMAARVSLYEFIREHLYDSDTDAFNQALFKLYEAEKEHFWSADALLAADTNRDRHVLYGLLTDYLEAHPNAQPAPQVTNLINRIKQPSVEFSAPEIVARGQSASIDINARNTDKVCFALYKITSEVANNISSVNLRNVATEHIADIDVTLPPGEAIPYESHATASFTLSEYGVYCLVPTIDGNKLQNMWPTLIRCTDMMTLSLSDTGKTEALVTDLTTGAPLGDVEVRIKSGGYRKDASFGNAKTDSLGLAAIKSVNYGDIFAVKDADKYGASTSFYNRTSDTNRVSDANIFTDLPVYHPGDSVKCAGVLYSYDKESQRLLTGQPAVFTLFDANYQQVDTREAVTDDFGRAEVQFRLPTAGLTGRFTISVSTSNKALSRSKSILVSDYKLPTFEVVADSIDNRLSENHTVTIGGYAKYYSGFEVADAEVKVTLRGRRNLWWFSDNTPEFYTLTTRTDSEGRFNIVLSDTIINLCPVTGAVIEAMIAVTSPAGETRMTTASVVVGKPCYISVNAPENIDTAKPARISIDATDAAGKHVDIKVNIVLTDNAGTPVYESTVSTPVTSLDLSNVPSGEYTLSVAPEDESLADDPAATKVILYRTDDLRCPVDSDLWVPETEIRLAAGATSAGILYGTSNDAATIFVITNYKDKSHDIKAITPSKGLHTLNVDLLGQDAPTNVTLLTVHNATVTQSTVTLYPEPFTRSLKIETESFRDHVTSGDTETWTVRAVDSSGTAQTTAFILSLYSKAITTLSPAQNSITFNRYRWYPTTVQAPSNSFFNAFAVPFDIKEYTMVSAPTFNSMFSHIMVRGTGAVMYKNAMTVSEDMAMADYAVTESAMEVAEDEADGDNGGSDGEQPAQTQYRAVETPSAFFAPMLTSEEDGRLTYSFTLPDANTTWVFDALGYTADPLLGASLTRDVIADKPVMVNSNLPRYLRQGDAATLTAMLMNNTDEQTVITATVEILDPMTMQIIDSQSAQYTLEGRQSSVISVAVTAPSDAEGLIYRVKATNGTFTDGEQKLLPILDATQPVIETTPFYIAPDRTQFDVTVPPKHSDSRVTLQLCENIAWEVVTALPGLMQGETNTSNSAAARLFSAAMAEGIMRDNPEIARAIRSWTDSDRSDSTLISMLERNSDLKTLMLNATPWVAAAASDTERMTRLALLLNRRAIADTYAETVALLEKLECSDGGWAWMSGYDRPSLWSTYNILSMLAQLNRLGYMPDNDRLKKMTERALAYLDRTNVADYAKQPKGDYSYYAYIRSLLPTPTPSTAARRVIDNAVQQILGNWGEMSLTTRAIDAIILEKNGYHASAKQIVQSLSEYAEKSPAKGMWWPRLDTQAWWSSNSIAATSMLLDAYATVDPGNSDIDLIRQWLIINKTTQDFGSSVATTEVCASILAAGTKWTVPASGLSVALDGKEITLPSGNSYTGYTSTDITSDLTAEPSTLMITKRGNYPSFGVVTDRFTGVMRRIQANSCEAVSINKRHLVKKGTEWVESDDCEVGDIVKISLTIKVDQALDYVAVTDNRAACLEPVEQTPRPIYADGLCFYRENRDSATNLFIDRLPRGTYILEYEMTVTNAGQFASGIATVMSQYNPAMTAHSSGTIITVK